MSAETEIVRLKRFLDEFFVSETPTHEPAVSCAIRLLNELTQWRAEHSRDADRLRKAYAYQWRKEGNVPVVGDEGAKG